MRVPALFSLELLSFFRNIGCAIAKNVGVVEVDKPKFIFFEFLASLVGQGVGDFFDAAAGEFI